MLGRVLLVQPAQRQLSQAQHLLLLAERELLEAEAVTTRAEQKVARMRKQLAMMRSDATRMRHAEASAKVQLDRLDEELAKNRWMPWVFPRGERQTAQTALAAST